MFTVPGQPKRLPSNDEAAILRIIQEALTNVLRHATDFRAELVFDRRAVRLNLRDDGCGFDPVQTHDGFGLIGIKLTCLTHYQFGRGPVKRFPRHNVDVDAGFLVVEVLAGAGALSPALLGDAILLGREL